MADDSSDNNNNNDIQIEAEQKHVHFPPELTTRPSHPLPPAFHPVIIINPEKAVLISQRNLLLVSALCIGLGIYIGTRNFWSSFSITNFFGSTCEELANEVVGETLAE
jgi:hypothetical protein